MTKSFYQHAGQWKAYQEKPWGRLFYSQSMKYLQPYIPNHPLKILDLGGGNGKGSIHYAREGHELVIFDIAENLLAEAEQEATDLGVVEKVDLIKSDINNLQSIYPNPEFDVVLCHNVLQYIKDIQDAIDGIVNCLKGNGVISLISMNRYSEVYRHILHELDPHVAREKIESNVYTSETFKEPSTLYSAEELFSKFQDYNLKIEDHFGIRCVNDYISDDNIKEDPQFFAALEQLEFDLGNRYPYNLLARFFHLIIRKVA